MRLCAPLGLCLSLTVMTEEALGQVRPQTPPAAGAEDGHRRIYSPEFYSAFSPRTALDMLERTPGFSVDTGSSVRGFAGAGGNVLVNGARLAAKADGVEDALRRIPAGQIERIEIIRSGPELLEAPGKSIVANIVMAADARASGSWSVLIERAPDGRVFPNAEFSYALPLGDWRASASLATEWEHHPLKERSVVTGPDGQVRQTGAGKKPGSNHLVNLSGALSGPLAGGDLALNARLNWQDEASRRIHAAAGSQPPAWSRGLDVDEEEIELGLGGDWTRSLGDGWQAKVVGLASIGRFAGDEYSISRSVGGAPSTSVSVQRQTPLEAVARVSVARQEGWRIKPEFGAEIAYNRLDSTLGYTVDGAAVDLPSANVRVREYRGELFAKGAMDLTGTLSVEAGLALEVSRISVAGDADESMDFQFWKPSAALIWQATPNAQVRLAALRKVGQLDFNDFAASVEGLDDRETAGNPRLRPDQATRVALSWDQRFGGGGAFALEVFHEWRTDVLEYVPLVTGGEGIGNVDSARVWGVTANATVPLAPLLKGASLKLEGGLTHSTLKDPLTGRRREINGAFPGHGTVEFRHDLPRWRSAWGVIYEAGNQERFFYPGETLVWRNDAIWQAYAETTAMAPYKVKLLVWAADGERTVRERRLFDTQGRLTTIDRLDRQRGAYGMLTISRAF